MEASITLKKVGKLVRDKTILASLTFGVERGSIVAFIGDNEAAQTVTVQGLSFEVIAKAQPVEDKTATITVVGNETGGSVTINLTVEKQELETTPGVALQAM